MGENSGPFPIKPTVKICHLQSSSRRPELFYECRCPQHRNGWGSVVQLSFRGCLGICWGVRRACLKGLCSALQKACVSEGPHVLAPLRRCQNSHVGRTGAIQLLCFHRPMG